MTEVNQAVREVAENRGALLVDLAALMAGHEEYFVDPIHLTPDDAVPRKAAILADSLAPLLRQRAESRRGPSDLGRDPR